MDMQLPTFLLQRWNSITEVHDAMRTKCCEIQTLKDAENIVFKCRIFAISYI